MSSAHAGRQNVNITCASLVEEILASNCWSPVQQMWDFHHKYINQLSFSQSAHTTALTGLPAHDSPTTEGLSCDCSYHSDSWYVSTEEKRGLGISWLPTFTSKWIHRAVIRSSVCRTSQGFIWALKLCIKLFCFFLQRWICSDNGRCLKEYDVRFLFFSPQVLSQ